MSDEALRPLVERARKGDVAALAALFGRYEPDVARVCRRLLGPGPASEDAASEVFLRARRGFDGYDAGRPFLPWLLGIASHQCIDALRRQRREVQLFVAGDLEAANLPDPGPSPLHRVAREEQRNEIVAAVEALPEKYRQPLVLRYFHDLDYAGIGDVLGLEREQVGTLLYRAKRRLREALTDAAEDA